jgi:hypothetical protein
MTERGRVRPTSRLKGVVWLGVTGEPLPKGVDRSIVARQVSSSNDIGPACLANFWYPGVVISILKVFCSELDPSFS